MSELRTGEGANERDAAATGHGRLPHTHTDGVESRVTGIAGPGVLDAAHLGDIQGAFGTIRPHDADVRRSWQARLLPLLITFVGVNQEMVVLLGAVTGVGHARLINERFGKFWGAFSVGDLFILNFLTISTEFIGVSLALGYFGVSQYISVPLAACSLVVMTATGSFRRWERFMFIFIVVNFLVI